MQEMWLHAVRARPKLIKTERRIYSSVQHTNIDSDNGLSPVRQQAIISTTAAMSNYPYETYSNDILFKSQRFYFKEMHLKMSSAKWRPFCLGLC